MSSSCEYDKFNALKGMAIFFVVWIHLTYNIFHSGVLPPFFDLFNYCTMFAVPLFLLTGGYFFAGKYICKGDGLSSNAFIVAIRGVINRIVIPYYIFVILLTIFNIASGKEIYWPQFFFIDARENGLYFLIIYVYAFMFSLILYRATRDFSDKQVASLIALCSLVFFPITALAKNSFPDNVVLHSLPLISFYCFGIPLYFISKKVKEIYLSKNNKKIIIVLLVMCMGMFTVILFFLRRYFGSFPVFVSHPPTIYLLIYSLFVFLLSSVCLSSMNLLKILQKIKIVSFGSNSLFIFLFHPYLVKICIPAVKFIFNKLHVQLFSNVLFPVIIVLSYLIVFLSDMLFENLPGDSKRIFSR